jgi:hypothetical protein
MALSLILVAAMVVIGLLCGALALIIALSLLFNLRFR